MFDWIKALIGIPDCRGCRWRRLWGLYCGCTRKSAFPHRAWNFDDLWCFSYANRPRDGRMP